MPQHPIGKIIIAEPFMAPESSVALLESASGLYHEPDQYTCAPHSRVFQVGEVQATGFDSRHTEFFPTTSIPAVGVCQCPIPIVQGASWPRREAEYSSATAEVT